MKSFMDAPYCEDLTRPSCDRPLARLRKYGIYMHAVVHVLGMYDYVKQFLDEAILS
jgi:hypothetical protein